jgi:hypothetical protein
MLLDGSKPVSTKKQISKTSKLLLFRGKPLVGSLLKRAPLAMLNN